MERSVPVGRSPLCMGITVWQSPHRQIWCEPRWRTFWQPSRPSWATSFRGVTVAVYAYRRLIVQ